MVVAGLAFYAITLLLDMCELTGFKVSQYLFACPFLTRRVYFLKFWNIYTAVAFELFGILNERVK